MIDQWLSRSPEVLGVAMFMVLITVTPAVAMVVQQQDSSLRAIPEPLVAPQFLSLIHISEPTRPY